MIDIIYLIITYESQIREHTTHRSKYIEDILKQHNVMDKVTINENSEIKDSGNNVVDKVTINENSEIKDSGNTIKYYTDRSLRKMAIAATAARNFRLVRACLEARCAFKTVDYDTDLIPLIYDTDGES
jgi:hypothetical protein